MRAAVFGMCAEFVAFGGPALLKCAHSGAKYRA